MAKGISVYPQTYTGYDEDNNVIITREAEKAENYIKPQEVHAAIENIKTVVDTGLKQIAKAISEVKCGEEMLVVADKTMQPMIEELAEQIAGKNRDTEIAPLVKDMGIELDKVYERACDAYDDIQGQLNSQAEQACWVSKVTRVV